MENPIAVARKQAELSRRELALLSGTSYHLVHAAERGLLVNPPEAVLNGLEVAGIRRDEVAAQYRAYRESLRDEIQTARKVERRA